MYSAFRPLKPSTSIDRCCSCRFSSRSHPQLAILRGTWLEIWNVTQQTTQPMELAQTYEIDHANSLVALPPGFSRATHPTIDPQRLPQLGFDALALSFDVGKISIVAFDPDRPTILKTLAIMDFEPLLMQSGLFTPSHGMYGEKCQLVMDPRGRCMTMVMNSAQVLVMPFRDLNLVAATLDSFTTTESSSTVSSSTASSSDPRLIRTQGQILTAAQQFHPCFDPTYVLPLARFGVPEHGIIDMVFLEGDNPAPTLAILYSTPIRSWAARAAVARQTCALTIISLVPENPLAASRVWGVGSLPSDAQRVIPVPKEPNVLVLSTNAVQYVDTCGGESRIWNMAVNGFAHVSISSSQRIHDITGRLVDVAMALRNSNAANEEAMDINISLTLDGCRWEWVDDRVVLLALQHGVMFEVSLDRPHSLHGRLVGGGGPFSCVCKMLGTNYVFWGSRQADSWLIRHFATPVAITETNKKRPRVTTTTSSVDADAEDRELYATWNEADYVTRAPEMRYEIEDVLRSAAPLIDFDFAEGLPTSPLNEMENSGLEDAKILHEAEEQANELRKLGHFSKAASRRSHAQNVVAERRKVRANAPVPRDLDIVACGPTSHAGGVMTVFQSGFRCDLRTEVTVQECGGLWYLDVGHSKKLLVMSESTTTRIFSQTSATTTAWEEKQQDELLTMDEATIYCFAFFEEANVARVVQVTPSRIRHVSTSTKRTSSIVSEIPLLMGDSSSSVSSCTHDGDTLALVFVDGTVCLWGFGAGGEWSMEFKLSSSSSSRRPPEGALDGIACVSLFRGARGSKLMIAAVRAGIAEPGAGLVEIHEITPGERPQFLFSSSYPLPLGVSLLNNAPAETLGTASRGVLANSRVLDVCVCRVGDTNKLVMVAALADGDLLVYARNDDDDRWTRVEHGVLTRGLRGRTSRPRKFAQPTFAKHFRGNILFRARVATGGFQGVFYAGQRPCWITSHRGRVTVIPHASTVSALLQVPLAPPTLHAGMIGEFVGVEEDVGIGGGGNSNGEDVQQRPHEALLDKATKTSCPTPLEVYKVRGAIQAFCAMDGGNFVYALRAPEPRATTTTTTTTATTSGGGSAINNPTGTLQQNSSGGGLLKLTALRFCALLGEREAVMEGLECAAPTIRRKLPLGGWGAARVCYLASASRGGPEEMSLGLHAPTFAVVAQRDALESSAADKAKIAAAIKANRTDDVRGSLYQQQDEEDELEDMGYQADELQPVDAFGGAPPVVEVRQCIQLVRAPDTTRVLSSFELLPDERVMCMMVMTLDVPSEDAATYIRNRMAVPRQQRKGMLVVGTGCVSSRGEDQDSRARLLVFEIDHASDASLSEQEIAHVHRNLSRPATVPLLRLVASVTQRGPIAAVAQLDGKILASTGNIPCSVKLLELNPREGRLVPIGFFDAPTCIIGINVVKDQFVLLSDLSRSVLFVRWRERQFYLLAKSVEPMKIFSSEFLVDGKHLAMVASDEETNLRMWNFSPERKAVDVCGEIRIGDKIAKMRSRRVPVLPPITATLDLGVGGNVSLALAQRRAMEEARWAINFVTLHGGLGFVVPIEEKIFRRLDLLQTAMVSSPWVGKNAGINPAAVGAVVIPEKLQRKKKGNVIDGRIVWKFVNLERTAQRRLALSVGSTVDTLLDTLLELDLLGSW